MEMKKMHWGGIGLSVAIIITSLFFMKKNIFILMISVGVLTGIFPFVFSLVYEAKVEKEKEEMFLEFVRGLTESVKTGVPISKSIVNLKGKNYGYLSRHIEKLANQISLGIPLNTALETFSKDVNNKTITRAIILIGQAERSGGDIKEILESVAEAVWLSESLKKERQAAVSTLVIQGYIIFFIFLIIILVLQFKILPMMSGITEGGAGLEGFTAATGTGIGTEGVIGSFLYLILTQGFFSGLTIGKLAEGNVKFGIKHSFVLMLVAFLVYSIANLFIGGQG